MQRDATNQGFRNRLLQRNAATLRACGLCLALLAVLLSTGCATTPVSVPWMQLQEVALRDRLLKLSNTVDPNEAATMAVTAMEQSAALAVEYRAVWPAWFHNWLVNGGHRERGLCFEWTNDLYPRLYALKLKTLEIHLAVADMDTWLEHNAIVVTARDQPFKEGVVLDAWRHSGRLWFGSVATDSHPWVPLPRDRVAPELEKYVKK